MDDVMMMMARTTNIYKMRVLITMSMIEKEMMMIMMMEGWKIFQMIVTRRITKTRRMREVKI